jgi:hypothetical protein
MFRDIQAIKEIVKHCAKHPEQAIDAMISKTKLTAEEKVAVKLMVAAERLGKPVPGMSAVTGKPKCSTEKLCDRINLDLTRKHAVAELDKELRAAGLQPEQKLAVKMFLDQHKLLKIRQ